MVYLLSWCSLFSSSYFPVAFPVGVTLAVCTMPGPPACVIFDLEVFIVLSCLVGVTLVVAKLACLIFDLEVLIEFSCLVGAVGLSAFFSCANAAVPIISNVVTMIVVLFIKVCFIVMPTLLLDFQLTPFVRIIANYLPDFGLSGTNEGTVGLSEGTVKNRRRRL